MAKIDPAIQAHLEWIGFVRPTGLVVSAPALVRAGAILERTDSEGQRLLRACVEEHEGDPKVDPVPYLPDFRSFTESVLGWNYSPKGYAGTTESPIPSDLEVPLPDYGETLRPDYAVRELDPQNGTVQWQLLIKVLERGDDFDRIVRGDGQLEASAHSRMERLLRETRVHAGLLFNGQSLRLLSAPRGESSGWLDFRVADMVQTAGRPISTAMRLLLSQPRLLSLPRAQRLAALLEDSRKFQNEVSERLAEQVLHALYELLRGFQAAHDASSGELLRQPLAEHADQVYHALLTVILRLVFLLYAEERDMLPENETFLRYYSLAGLYDRLREDAALYPDTMDQRYSAWAQLLVLFRMVYDGAEAEEMHLPERHGVLFDPDRFPFLEGRSKDGAPDNYGKIEPPLVPDGTIYRALDKILILDGERISYRALDVEQIGSVYETMMGFRLETAIGLSVAIKSPKKWGAPTAVNLEDLLNRPEAERAKWLQKLTERKLTDKLRKAAAASENIEDLHAALLPVIDLAASPDLVPSGAMVLQPSEERRRSGSHYTPRTLTKPIVHTALKPVLARLRGSDGKPPRPAQILDLKVCDPAMGSGAFLVETCRMLGNALVESWRAHDEVPTIPADEDEVIFARRLIAQRCLYGIDRNPVAVDLAKVSLWLVTLAKNHALTFLNHALRHGDSLVGLSRRQIEAFHWDPDALRFKAGFETMRVHEHITKVVELRQSIREADESVSDSDLRDLWEKAQLELGKVRLFGDLVLAAFFEGENNRAREAKRNEYANVVVSNEAERYRDWLQKWRHADPPFAPFHWIIEFPEVFDRENPGFDAVVGNPPFAGIVTLGGISKGTYTDYLRMAFPHTKGKTDLVAFFFRKGYNALRSGGTVGFIATKTIRQGDTRASSLEPILTRLDGVIYNAVRRRSWPGMAAVVISIIHLSKGQYNGRVTLDGQTVDRISAYLVQGTNDLAPLPITTGRAGLVGGYGNKPNGRGFLFAQTGSGTNPLSLKDVLLQKDPRYVEVIKPYLGGKEMNDMVHLAANRWIIDFEDQSLEEAARYPDLLSLLEERVKPEVSRKNWWQFEHRAVSLKAAIRENRLKQVLAVADASDSFAFYFLPSDWCYSNSLVVFATQLRGALCVLQSRVHETWVRAVSLTLKDDLRYVPGVCLETFPFPEGWEINAKLEVIGKAYYDFRTTLMTKNNEGLTKTCNRFHDPDEHDPEILKLRELHAAMDRAILDAYGWSDIKTECEFLLDYQIDEEEWGNKKKPWRYRWPDEVRDDVLARLLELNAERAEAEGHSDAATEEEHS